MEFSALDPAQIIALMAAGGLFALAGLWLMFRPKLEGHAAKIELFGMKFESSSAGLLVFLIGAAFLASPLFVQERATAVSSSSSGAGSANPTGAEGTGFSPARSVAITSEGTEVEPNDGIPSANVVPLGAAATGKVDQHTDDYFLIEIPEDLRGQLFITATVEGKAH